MSELNIPLVSHNPLQSQPRPRTLAENVRAGEEVKLKKAAAQAAQVKNNIMMEEYWTKKKTENYVFSHYPSGSHAHWSKGYRGLKFTPSNKAKAKRDWLSNVGGNLSGFEQYWQQGHKAEMEGLKKSLIYDPNSGMSANGWSAYVTEEMNKWSPTERSMFFNNLDAETRQYTNQTYRPSDHMHVGDKIDVIKDDVERFFDRWTPRGDSSPLATGLFGLTGVGALGYGGKKVYNKISDWMGGADDLADLDDTGTPKPPAAGTGSARSELFDRVFRTGSGVGDDVIDTAEKGRIYKRMKTLVQDGGMSEEAFDTLVETMQKLNKDGKPLTTKNIFEKIQGLGEKNHGLMNALDEHAEDIGFKGWKTIKGLGIGLGGGLAAGEMTKQAVTALVGGKNAEVWGEAAGALGTPVGFAATNVLYDKIKQHGAPKVLSYIGKKAGWKKLAQLMGRQFLGHAFGIKSAGVGYAVSGGFLLADAIYIAKILEDLE